MYNTLLIFLKRNSSKAFLLFVVCLFDTAHAQSNLFEISFGRQGADVAQQLCQLNDSNIYVVGYSQDIVLQNYDFMLTKVNQFGNILWMKYYGTSLNDQALGLTKTSDGNLVLAGVTESSIIQGSNDILIIKTDTAGNELWRKTFSGNGNLQAKRILELPNGNLIICGNAPDPFGSVDGYIIITDSAGNLINIFLVGGAGADGADGISIAAVHTFAVALTTTELGNSDTRISFLDSAGILLYDSIIATSIQDGSQGIMLSTKNQYVLFGETEVSTFSPFDFLFEFFDSTGKFISRIHTGGVGTDAAFDLIADAGGTFTGTGYSNSFSGGSNPLNLVVFRIDSTANLLWQHEYGSSGIDIGYAIIPALSGGYYVAGRTSTNNDDCYLLHIDDSGLIAGLTDQILTKSFELFPNPSNNFINIIDDNLITNVDVLTGDGRVIKSINVIPSKHLSININDLEDGLYLVRVSYQNGRQLVKRFVANHSF